MQRWLMQRWPLRRWGMHRLAFAIGAPVGTAALVAWLLFGRDGLHAVLHAWTLLLVCAHAVIGIGLSVRKWWVRRQPITPEDRDRRWRERDARRRARQGAMRAI